jgi:hypothetical protein
MSEIQSWTPSNLLGHWINNDTKNGMTILSIYFRKENCTFAYGIHCIEPGTVCIQIAPEEIDGHCYYNNHTNTLSFLTGKQVQDSNGHNYTFNIYFQEKSQLTLMNNCNSNKSYEGIMFRNVHQPMHFTIRNS